ncbi:PepSY domain-containing protein [Thiomicrorhabdus sp. Milos-T2]|uniref:PepSY-associated TM helix domain-containing protein n=1 Tax=Thiomicrorhabdus sp. Milos-T2 TaxID=90814 RepID=UPI000493DEEC|nr:PepSY-associated TM helix domain-containing protein [Thiomicrorhabdus sp. Milos-T2]
MKLKWRQLHLAFAFCFAIPLLSLAISGAGLSFSNEIDRAFNPDLRNCAPSPGKNALSLDQLMTHIWQALPADNQTRLETLFPARTPFDTTRVDYINAENQLIQAFFNPYSGKLLGKRPANETLTSFLTQWHYDLWSPVWMHWLFVISSVGLMVLILSGLPNFLKKPKLLHAKVGIIFFGIWGIITISALLISVWSNGFSARIALNANDLKPTLLKSHSPITKNTLSAISNLTLPLPLRPLETKNNVSLCPKEQGIAKLKLNSIWQGQSAIEAVCQSNEDYGVVFQTRWALPILNNQVQMNQKSPITTINNLSTNTHGWLWGLHSGEVFGLIGRMLWMWASLLLIWMLWSGFNLFLIRKTSHVRKPNRP